MEDSLEVVRELQDRFGASDVIPQVTRDDVPTVWIPAAKIREVVDFLKTGVADPYRLLYDLTAIDERERTSRDGQPPSDFTVVYHLLSFQRNQDVRLKVALQGETPSLPSITSIWPMADWYEREVWDMFGIRFDGHPHLVRILMPPTWEGHPLRKDHPARATEMGPFTLPEDRQIKEQEALRFNPEEWGMVRKSEDADFMFLNLGPQHPGTRITADEARFVADRVARQLSHCLPGSVLVVEP